MDCVIKIIKGPETGQEFRLSGAEAVVGRSARSHVRLESPTVSFEHAVISRSSEEFFVENLSANGTFVNEERITGKIRLRAKDQLRFGQETVGRVEAVPTAAGAGNRKWLMIAVVTLVVVLIGAWVWTSLFPSAPPGFNLYDAYPKIEAYAQDQVAKKKLPAQDLDMLQDAWRLEMAKDREESMAKWRDLNILLSSQDAQMGFQEASQKNHGALEFLAKNDGRQGPPTEDELKAGLVQFVARLAQPR